MPPALHKKIKLESAKRGVSMREFCLEAIEGYLKAKRDVSVTERG